MAHILVIDDDQLIRDMVALTLGAEGHTVVQAESGVDGLAAFRTRPADLVITDMAMPKMDGVQLIERLLKEYPNLPIIAMSGAPDSAQYLYLASYLGAGRLLTKPFKPETLRGAVDGALKPSA
jgi:DNA-binding response OmpR family regulator